MQLHMNTIAYAARPSLTDLFLTLSARYTGVPDCGPRAFTTESGLARHDQQKAVA